MKRSNLKTVKAEITKESLSDSSSAGEWVALTFDEAYNALGNYLAGTETIQGLPCVEWVLESVPLQDIEDKRLLLKFLVAFQLFDSTSNQPNLTIAKKDLNGNILSVATIEECDFTRTKCVVESMLEGVLRKPREVLMTSRLAKRQGGFPEVFRSEKYRFECSQMIAKLSLIRSALKLHKLYGPDGPHWCISFAVVAPGENGAELRLELMRKVNVLADERKVDCYIVAATEYARECYESLGYETVAKETLQDPDKSVALQPLYFMVRKHQACS